MSHSDAGSDARIENVLLELAQERDERGAGRTICPSEVARALEGADEKRWRLLMKPVRAVAVRLAREGRIEIRRKGKAVDPANFKGIYRIGLPSSGADDRAPDPNDTNEPQGDTT